MKKNVKQEICIPDGVINGFCYSFTKALIEKLKELQKEDRIFKEGLKKARSNVKEDCGSPLTQIAYTVINKICEQIEYGSIDSTPYPSEIVEMINFFEEFLAIFETKK